MWFQIKRVPYKIMLVSLRPLAPSDSDGQESNPSRAGLLREQKDCTLRELCDLTNVFQQEV